MVTVVVLELPVARVAQTAVHLHRLVGGIAGETIRAVIADRNGVRQALGHFALVHLVHFPGGLEGERS